MAYSDIQDRLGQQQMANSVLLAEKYSQGNLFPKGSEGNPYSKNPRAQSAKRKRDYKKAQDEKTEAKRVSDEARQREFQRRKERGEVFGDMPPDFNLMETLGPSLNKLLQIGGAAGSMIPFMGGNIFKMFIRNPNAMASTFPYDFEGGVVTPRYFTPPRYRNQPFLHMRTKDITDEELFHFNNFIKSMGGGLDTVRRQTPLSIAGLPHSPPVEKMVVGNKLEDSPLRFRTDAERIRFMEDFAKYDRPRA
jgi:hypothetical protein